MNKSSLLLFVTLLFFVLSCESDNKDGFCLEINNDILYNSEVIDFYDFSSHLIYLKDGNNFTLSDQGTFSVSVDAEKIYSGGVYPLYSSYLPVGPYIQCCPSFYNDYIIPVSFRSYTNSEGITNEDPRSDPKIIESLIAENKYKRGLSGEILSIEKLSESSVKITLQITNLDSEDLLILDPDKMGLGLFHYYTNGLSLYDAQYNKYSNNLAVSYPDPRDLWESSWFSVLEGNGVKTVSITYDSFDNIPAGNYTAYFNYPGLSSQIEKSELQQNNGRIWLGKLINTSAVFID